MIQSSDYGVNILCPDRYGDKRYLRDARGRRAKRSLFIKLFQKLQEMNVLVDIPLDRAFIYGVGLLRL